MISKAKMLEHLNMFWEGEFDFNLPSAGTAKNAVQIFKTNLATITWNCMATLENNPSTLPQTETILKGQSVTGLSIDELMQIKHYGEGARILIDIVTNGTFVLDEKTACALHGFVGKDEALTWGKFRDSLVRIQLVDEYTPPDSKLLSGIAASGFSFLEDEIESPKERAAATFLFMARTQFFHDANKRTASLMMNGVLMKDCMYPITIMKRDSEEFHTKLRDFYNTGNATEMMRFFEKTMQKMYSSD
jgi:Fic family protein